jgi:hypothetical protein
MHMRKILRGASGTHQLLKAKQNENSRHQQPSQRSGVASHVFHCLYVPSSVLFQALLRRYRAMPERLTVRGRSNNQRNELKNHNVAVTPVIPPAAISMVQRSVCHA